MESNNTNSNSNSLTSPNTGLTSDGDGARNPGHPLHSARICRYFSRTGSCRAGTSCQYLHDDTRLPGSAMKGKEAEQSESSVVGDDGKTQDRRQAVTKPVPASRVVPKPVPQAQAQDPREFQLGQIRRRFSPKETNQHGGALLKFSLAPSDPDFPFEMSALDCLLSVPSSYPKDKPSLKVGNKDIPRGFAINVEQGFEGLVEEKPDATLLELMKALDKNLETFLSAPKADTVKLVPNKDTRHLSSTPSRAVEPIIAPRVEVESTKPLPTSSTSAPKSVENFTSQQKSEALKTREAETRQLEARMGRLPLYKKSGDGIAYTLPLEPRRRNELPVVLQAVKTTTLFVPLLYPLQPCRIGFEGIDGDAPKSVEAGFLQRATEQKATLMAQVNYLASNMYILAKNPLATPPVKAPEPIATTITQAPTTEGHQDPERSHIQYISRPPEWEVIDHEDVSDADTDDLYSYDTGDSSDQGGGVEVTHEAEAGPAQPAPNPERGTAISFPFIELYGIELLEVVNLNITVKCERCKETTEVKSLKTGITKSESCRKCATPLSITFRRDLVHAHAVRAGFLDLEGCIVGDMLPSTFQPTCSQCSTPYPLPGIVSVRGETTTNVCRECHQKFTFSIPTIKFLRISSSHLPSSLPPRRKKETLGLVPGTELPKRGRCRHYAKSYRWFRFSCCAKVYACDKCHDAEEEHVHEWANRMVCGWCSREQNYRPEDCGVCHGNLTGKRGGTAFWEGGKGTRDRVKMSRKDPRKHRRVGGGGVKKS
ncbi:uncharacterized protein LY89DRAFT_652748 [Mollisia scopiformis]|uniref:CHY-type domain-containing protein n=1 Tax=Mollisia scopiformis TaxID=149040 RepID=A0A194WWG3_MOLSC|nr:uncharacterized protein LY89DRAFT_652748 [Mollisia scopiformis]KUJ12318.1 hypothetical protein LY89DRAFT_652748 [Mollisia scopiformis]